MADLTAPAYLPIYLSILFWFREGALNRRPDALAGAAPPTIQSLLPRPERFPTRHARVASSNATTTTCPRPPGQAEVIEPRRLGRARTGCGIPGDRSTYTHKAITSPTNNLDGQETAGECAASAHRPPGGWQELASGRWSAPGVSFLFRFVGVAPPEGRRARRAPVPRR
jgi:hypothetical protein